MERRGFLRTMAAVALGALGFRAAKGANGTHHEYSASHVRPYQPSAAGGDFGGWNCKTYIPDKEWFEMRKLPAGYSWKRWVGKCQLLCHPDRRMVEIRFNRIEDSPMLDQLCGFYVVRIDEFVRRHVYRFPRGGQSEWGPGWHRPE
jgi:hypothetical protein